MAGIAGVVTIMVGTAVIIAVITMAGHATITIAAKLDSGNPFSEGGRPVGGFTIS
jgi:hypothetical protein